MTCADCGEPIDELNPYLSVFCEECKKRVCQGCLFGHELDHDVNPSEPTQDA